MEKQTLKEVLNIISSIKNGYCGPPQPLFLYNLSKNLQGVGEIVEIGSYTGKSSISLAFAQKEKNGKPIYSIDINAHPEIISNLKKAGVQDWVRLIIGYSAQIGRHWNRPVELLWIDGSHSFASVATDIKVWTPYVVEGGYAAFHDYPGLDHVPKDYGQYDVHKAIYKFILSNPSQWRVVNDRDDGTHIIVFQKLTPPKNKMKKVQPHIRFIYKITDIKFYINDYFYGNPVYKILLKFYRKIRGK